MSLNDLSHLDDSELNFMSSREMLALSVQKAATDSTSDRHQSAVSGNMTGLARPASIDDSVIDDSARGVSTVVPFDAVPLRMQSSHLIVRAFISPWF